MRRLEREGAWGVKGGIQVEFLIEQSKRESEHRGTVVFRDDPAAECGREMVTARQTEHEPFSTHSQNIWARTAGGRPHRMHTLKGTKASVSADTPL